MEDVTKLNLTLALPDEVKNWAYAASDKLAKELKLTFKLDENSKPHITLYYTAFPTKNLEKIKQITELLAKEYQQQELIFTEFILDSGYLTANFEKTEAIKKLHLETLAKLNPLRDGYLRAKYHDDVLQDLPFKLTDEQIRIVKTYGHPYVENEYQPHLSLGMIADESETEAAIKSLQELNRPIERFASSGLVLYAMGENGTCKDVLAEFPFKN